MLRAKLAAARRRPAAPGARLAAAAHVALARYVHSRLTPDSACSASGQQQELAAAQATAGASTAAAARALKMAQEAREVACATLNELGSQADALKSAAASLGEAEAAVHASERTLDDINAGCFGCFGPKRRLARRLPTPAAAANEGSAWRRFWTPAGGASSGGAAATERREAPAPAEATSRGGGGGTASQRPRKAASAKSAAARARLASSQPGAAVAGGSGSRDVASRFGGGGSAFGDSVLDKKAAAQDATLSELDAVVRCSRHARHALLSCAWVVACGAPASIMRRDCLARADAWPSRLQVSELGIISSRIGEELDQQARGPASEAARQSVSRARSVRRSTRHAPNSCALITTESS